MHFTYQQVMVLYYCSVKYIKLADEVSREFILNVHFRLIFLNIYVEMLHILLNHYIDALLTVCRFSSLTYNKPYIYIYIYIPLDPVFRDSRLNRSIWCPK